MKKKKFKILTMLPVALIMAGLLVASISFSQELPAPGTVIDKSNYKRYQHLFPAEWLTAFEDGFQGLVPPLKLQVKETKRYPEPKAFVEISAKNKGKYSLNAQGNITPKFDFYGLPFPDLRAGDKDFATKLMWNYASGYGGDDCDDPGGTAAEKRRGSSLYLNNVWKTPSMNYQVRLVCPPKPHLPNPQGLYRVAMYHYLEPDSLKNTMYLMYRYIDESKSDETYLYLPSMRRVLRAESGQRSAPIPGSLNSMDDAFGFDGRTPEFTYKLLKEQKVLAIINGRMDINQVKKGSKDFVPLEMDNYEVRDVYVIEIVPKDPKYPQGKKILYVDKETRWATHAVAYDRAGKLWKLWWQSTKSYPMPGGEQFIGFFNNLTVDVQYGMATNYIPNPKIKMNTCKFDTADFTPQAMLKRAR